MNPVEIVGSLLKIALDIGKEATAEQKADMLMQIDDTRGRLAALPSMSAAVHDVAEKRKAELRASIEAGEAELRRAARERKTDPGES